MEALTVQTSSRPDGWHVLASGELDASTAEEFRRATEAVVAAEHGEVHLDLCGLRFIDSTGLHTLLNLHRHLVRHGRHLRVECASGAVMRLFELARLVETLDVVERRADGAESSPGPPLRLVL